MGRIRTLRGRIDAGSQLTDGIRLSLDNGSFTSNFRVLSFEIYGNAGPSAGFWNLTISNNDITFVTLALDEDGLGYQNFEDNRQIGWFAAHGVTNCSNTNTILDPDHIIVNDLWLGAYAVDTGDGSTDPTTVPLHYKITIEAVETDEDIAVMALIKERSQADLP